MHNYVQLNYCQSLFPYYIPQLDFTVYAHCVFELHKNKFHSARLRSTVHHVMHGDYNCQFLLHCIPMGTGAPFNPTQIGCLILTKYGNIMYSNMYDNTVLQCDALYHVMSIQTP